MKTKEEIQKMALETALTSYISAKHTQDECIGFIDGFKEGHELAQQETLKLEKINAELVSALENCINTIREIRGSYLDSWVDQIQRAEQALANAKQSK